MPDLRQTRKHLKIGLIAMAAVDLLAAGLYFSPLVGLGRNTARPVESAANRVDVKNTRSRTLERSAAQGSRGQSGHY